MKFRAPPPVPIRVFIIAYLASALTAASYSVASNSIPSQLAAHPELVSTMGKALIPIVIGTRLSIRIGLVWLVARRASNVAKWFVVLLSAAMVFNFYRSWSAIVNWHPLVVIWLGGFSLEMIATACLFMPQTRKWFEYKGQWGVVDASIFD